MCFLNIFFYMNQTHWELPQGQHFLSLYAKKAGQGQPLSLIAIMF